jgi:hypothetical protein
MRLCSGSSRPLGLVVSTAVALHLAGCRVLGAQERGPATEQAVALGAGTFIGFAGTDVAFLHLLGSYERRLSDNLDLVAEAGLVTDEDDLFAALAPALRLDLTPDGRPSLFVRAGPALLGTTSGVDVLVHLGTGIDLAAASNGLRFEVRTYVSPSHVSLDLLEVILSYRFDLRNGTQ